MELSGASLWYALGLISVFVLSGGLVLISRKFDNRGNAFSRHCRLPLIVSRRRWDSVTRLEATLLFFYFILNVLLILAPFTRFDWREKGQRCALLATVNVIPLCTGMRLGPVQTLNIHRSTYRLFHHWAGRVAIAQALCHSIITIAKRPRYGPLTYTGFGVFGGFIVALLLSLVWCRCILGRWFGVTHQVIIIGSLAILLWHVICAASMAAKVSVGVSCALLLLSYSYKLWRFAFPKISAIVTDLQWCPEAGVYTIEVDTNTEIKRTPGSYFRLSFPGLRRAPFRYSAVASYGRDNSSEGGSKLRFILSARGTWNRSLEDLKRDWERPTGKPKVALDGPYGKDYQLEAYDLVFIAAKGLGIAGVLPLIHDLAQRSSHDNRVMDEWADHMSKYRNQPPQFDEDRWKQKRIELQNKRKFLDATKKVVVLWSPDHSGQMDPVRGDLQALQRLDPDNKLLVVWCRYNVHKGTPPFRMLEEVGKRFWSCLDVEPQKFDSLISSQIVTERKNVHGRMIVVACGDAPFTNAIRKSAIAGSSHQPIDFVETEYRPN